ncbi:MAG: hypothetical protein HRU22_10290 [Gammaproteobacteria bacterium]|nr:hypothetical protein [Gammaproteobacteria bacterium]
MNIDQQIKQELEQEAKQLDVILAHEPGIFKMLGRAYQGALGGWMILVTILSLVVFMVFAWAGYEFFITEGVLIEYKLYWGFVMLLAVLMLIAMKMWIFMEMNRQSTNREIKRLELMVERLVTQLEK